MERTTFVIFVIGAPGAGKGTLCKNLARDFGLEHVSVGDTLRKAVLSPDVDKTILSCVQSSELLPTKLLFSVLSPHLLSETKGHARGTLLDGFPRQLDQAKSFEEAFGLPRLVLFFDCPVELAEMRVVQRLAGRDGDNHETFRKRYKEFSELNPSVVEYYRRQDKLVEIDTSGTTDTSYEKLLNVLKTRCEWEPKTS